jgi:hypothetical protein
MNKLCFATLSVGKNYVSLAKLLAKDIEKFAPGVPLITLTSHPQAFHDSPNVIAKKHYSKFRSDFDKCFLIENALSEYDVCICIDADMRILDDWPIDEPWLEGINARSCTSIVKHQTSRITREDQENDPRAIELKAIKKLAGKMGIDLERERVRWIHEFLFVVKKHGGKENDFIENFKKTALYCNVHNISAGCGVAMGLAAYKAEFPVHHHTMPNVHFFDDRIEKRRISKGKSNQKDSQHLFEELARIKNPQHSFLEKLTNKIITYFKGKYLRFKATINAFYDFDFYFK